MSHYIAEYPFTSCSSLFITSCCRSLQCVSAAAVGFHKVRQGLGVVLCPCQTCGAIVYIFYEKKESGEWTVFRHSFIRHMQKLSCPVESSEPVCECS